MLEIFLTWSSMRERETIVFLFLVRLPLTISIHRAEVDSLFLPDSGLASDYPDHDLYLPFNFSNLDWYLISAGDSKMSIISPPSMNFLTSINSTGLSSIPSPSSSIRAMPLVKAIPVALVLSSIVVLCICGNILVILSVFTFRPLRTVQNFFIVSLAFSDMFVAIMVMPFHIVTHLLNRWIFGKHARSSAHSLHRSSLRTNLLSNLCYLRRASLHIVDLESLCYCGKSFLC